MKCTALPECLNAKTKPNYYHFRQNWLKCTIVTTIFGSTLGCLPIFKNIFEQNGERPNESMQPKDLKSKISEDLAQK